MFSVFPVLWLHMHFSAALLQKETKLNAETPSQEGASIAYNSANVAISGTNYNIVVQSDDGYDLHLSLDKSWGFEHDTESEITFTLDGFTPNPTQDTDLLLLFSVADVQYFSFFLHLDSTNKIRSRIYDAISTSHTSQSVSDWISDDTVSSRWNRISNNDQWQIIYDWNEQALWPLKFVIINNPIDNQTVFEFYHDETETYATGYVFDDCFLANEAMDVYIMGDSPNERYNISSIDIELITEMNDDDDDSTDDTTKPTIAPTETPTFTTVLPTINPTLSTTKDGIFNTTELAEEAEYGILMVITFKYTLSLMEVSEIMIILHELTHTEDNECNDWDHDIIEESHNKTVITATILMCDELMQSALILAVDNGDLQEDILQTIRSETSLLMLANKTSIRADRIPVEHFNGMQTTDYIPFLLPYIPQRGKQSMNYYQLFMIIAIAIPIVSCCYCLSMKSNKKPKLSTDSTKSKQTKLSLSMHVNTLAMNHVIECEDDEDVAQKRVRSPSKSYQYKVRKYTSEANNSKIDNASYPMSPSSVMIGAREYDTRRGISDDIYEKNSEETATKGVSLEEKERYHEEEGSGSTGSGFERNHIKLSTESRVNTNSYPQSSTITFSPRYELPKYKVTKRQWL